MPEATPEAVPKVGEPLRSPLHDWHAAHGARFGDFAGWSMPLEYAGGGVVAEHRAVRQQVGAFDVSHLGTVFVTGPGARSHVDAVLTNDLGRIGPGRAQYTLCCTESGGVVDDLIVYLFSDDELMLVPNAANAAEVVAVLSADAPDGVEIRDQHTEYAVLAVQGPRSADSLAAMGLPTGMRYFGFERTRWGDGEPGAEASGVELTVCRTGYTGEHGYELVVPAAEALDVWTAVLEAGEPFGIRPAGLGARDTLRTEMGYPLHGHELSPQVSPLQARLSWAIGWKKAAFRGRNALVAERAAGPERLLVGLRHAGRRIPRRGMAVLVEQDQAGAGSEEGAGSDQADRDADEGAGVDGPAAQARAEGAAPVGVVTSGTFSPTLEVGIGLALVAPPYAEPGGRLLVDLRGRPEPFDVVKLPFVEPDVAG